MSNICKTVTLRTRKIKKGTQLSFYLDYYPGYRDESTMKVQRHESLGIYIFTLQSIEKTLPEHLTIETFGQHPVYSKPAYSKP